MAQNVSLGILDNILNISVVSLLSNSFLLKSLTLSRGSEMSFKLLYAMEENALSTNLGGPSFTHVGEKLHK